MLWGGQAPQHADNNGSEMFPFPAVNDNRIFPDLYCHGAQKRQGCLRIHQLLLRRSRRLVISSVSTVENYEYGFFWYLYQDGNIQLEVKLTGILSMGAFASGEKPNYGNLVAPQLDAAANNAVVGSEARG